MNIIIYFTMNLTMCVSILFHGFVNISQHNLYQSIVILFSQYIKNICVDSKEESNSITEAEVCEKNISHKDEDVLHEDCKTKDVSREGCKIKEDLPIPKPVNFTNLHSKLNLEKDVYQSYKVI